MDSYPNETLSAEKGKRIWTIRLVAFLWWLPIVTSQFLWLMMQGRMYELNRGIPINDVDLVGLTTMSFPPRHLLDPAQQWYKPT
ncbi:unnamed protein product [Anisakis simplex]|uniref:4-hydroxybenzoate transporter n=1 Tax=Anisakis simplex TaxID=6269 RepID=A0A0M3IZW0_ANISI|nr:unnamed protein product [Anisakis simplex]